MIKKFLKRLASHLDYFSKREAPPPERHQDRVFWAYKSVLGRTPFDEELREWTAKLVSGTETFADFITHLGVDELPHFLISPHSQENQDVHALQYLGFMEQGYFVELGACGGRAISNTYLLEKEYGWTGLCIEPVPRAYEKLVRNRPNSICSPALVYDEAGLEVDFNVPVNNKLAGIAETLGGHRGHSDSEETEVLQLTTTTLDLLLDEVGAPEVVDFLSLDTEGSEYKILSTFPFDKRRFRFITVEHNSETGKRDAIRNLLEANGYWLYQSVRQDDQYVSERPTGWSLDELYVESGNRELAEEV